MRQKTKDNILMCILGITFFLNIIVMNIFPPIIKGFVVIGWVILGIGALFVVLSIFMLRRKGVSKIIDSEVYGVVRHPMYIGGMVMFFSHIFFGQNLIVVISSIVGIVCCYLIILSADQRNIEKFGDDYRTYMANVPRMNFLLGIIRLLRRRNRG